MGSLGEWLALKQRASQRKKECLKGLLCIPGGLTGRERGASAHYYYVVHLKLGLPGACCFLVSYFFSLSIPAEKYNFLGISIVGQSNERGDGGIYIGSIMKGGAVAADGRIEPGDMLLQVLHAHVLPSLRLGEQQEKTQKPPCALWQAKTQEAAFGRGKLSHC